MIMHRAQHALSISMFTGAATTRQCIRLGACFCVVLMFQALALARAAEPAVSSEPAAVHREGKRDQLSRGRAKLTCIHTLTDKLEWRYEPGSTDAKPRWEFRKVAVPPMQKESKEWQALEPATEAGKAWIQDPAPAMKSGLYECRIKLGATVHGPYYVGVDMPPAIRAERGAFLVGPGAGPLSELKQAPIPVGAFNKLRWPIVDDFWMYGADAKPPGFKPAEYIRYYRRRGAQDWLETESEPIHWWGVGLTPWEAFVGQHGVFELKVVATDYLGQTMTTPVVRIELAAPPPELHGSYDMQSTFVRAIVNRYATGRRSGVKDRPNLSMAEWGDMVYHDGRFYIQNGDLHADGGKGHWAGSGLICSTVRVNLERMSFEHYHSWFHGMHHEDRWLDKNDATGKQPNGFPDPLGLPWNGRGVGMFMFPNTAFITELPDGRKRFWLAAETNSSKEKSGVALYYTDDEYATLNRSLQLVDLETPRPYRSWGHGPAVSGRIHRGYAYLFICKVLSKERDVLWNECILRCPVTRVNDETLADWHILERFDGNGDPVWSSESATPKAIQAGSPGDPGLRNEHGRKGDEYGAQPCTPDHAWIPFLNKWTNGIVVSDSLFGPFEHDNNMFWVDTREIVPGPDRSHNPGYGIFINDVATFNNGEIVFTIQSKDKAPRGGTHFHCNMILKHVIKPKTTLQLGRKCAVAGDTVEITASNSDFPELELDINVSVGGKAARLLRREGRTFHFQYTATGAENSGLPGRVNVVAKATSKLHPWPAHERSVALIVNHHNDLELQASFPDYTTLPDAGLAGAIRLSADVAYAGDVTKEVIEEGGPEVRILSVELWIDGALYHREVKAPYDFVINTREMVNGRHEVVVKAFDTLDRRAMKTLVVKVQNAPLTVAGNLIADGNMEEPGIDTWTVFGEAVVEKVGKGLQRDGGALAMQISSNRDGMTSGGIEQKIQGLQGGEALELTVWLRDYGFRSYDGGDTTVTVATGDGKGLLTERPDDNSHHYRPHTWAFTNPAGNTSLTIRVGISDTPDDGHLDTRMTRRVWVDNVVLHRSAGTTPVVADAGTFTVRSSAKANELSWPAGNDVNIQFTEIRRRKAGTEKWPFLPMVRLDRWDYAFHTGRFADSAFQPGQAYEYQLVHVDPMGHSRAPLRTVCDPK
ncbi:MAG: Ig-like domain-containing protein [Lentisphaerae bacterium]|nr:Ig-like domain-containing protein [Lentisphaerota bacterium]